MCLTDWKHAGKASGVAPEIPSMAVTGAVAGLLVEPFAFRSGTRLGKYHLFAASFLERRAYIGKKRVSQRWPSSVVGRAEFKLGVIPMRLASTTVLLVLVGFTMTSCSGVPGGGCVVNCSSGGSVSIVLTATPPPPTAALSIQALTATITGITLGPSNGGSPVALNLNSTTYIAEFNRATSDSILLASKVSVPSGTYNRMSVTFAAPKVTFCTQANSGVPGCANGTLASVIGTPSSVSFSTNLTVADNALTGIALNVNLGTAILQTGQTITGLDFTIANTFSAVTLPRPASATDLASTQLSHLDDIMGLVTGTTSTSITIQTSTRGSVTANTNSSTVFDCPAQDSSCVQTNQVAVMDGVLNSDGTITATFFEPLIDSGDMIEGVVSSVPNTLNNTFTLVATDSVFAPSNSVLNGALNIGDQMVVTLAGTVQPFVIVDKGLANPSLPANSFDGSTSISAVQSGMTVLFPVNAYTPQAGTTPGAASTVSFALRFSRITTIMAIPTSPDFTVSGVAMPPFFGITINELVRTNPNRLSVDGAQTITGIPVSNTVSLSAIYLGSSPSPALVAQSVRAH